MANPKVEVAIKHACSELGEGPHWDDASQSLLFVDIYGKEVHHWSPSSDKHCVKKFNERVGHVVPRAKGGYMIGLGRRFAEMHWDSDELKTTEDLEDGKSTFRFNDGKCDPKGRLWGGTVSSVATEAGDSFHKGAGSLYRLDLDRSVSKHHTELTVSNGLAWTADSRIMFLVDSEPRKLHAFDFDLEAGTLSNHRIVVTLPADTGLGAAHPDGMTIDTEDKLWIACWDGSAVVQLDAETGKLLRKIDIPAQQTSSVCWGGRNLDELYVTSARQCSKEALEKSPLSGSVFRVTGLGAKGFPAFTYQG
ncbi:regucalcin-like [Babylonia areolata]|uniref:regucalcin-like n=1 Tax=Babylonia areolata TaxID=304850 RepID=UPI003FCEE67D